MRPQRVVLAGAVLLLLSGAMHASSADGPPHSDSGYSAQGADTCLGCHSDAAVTGIFRTKHARPNDPHGPFGHGQLQCEACHGPGGAHVKAGGGPLAGMLDFGAKAASPAPVQNSVCLGCHQSNAAHDWATSAHAASNVACASCHNHDNPACASPPLRSDKPPPDVCRNKSRGR